MILSWVALSVCLFVTHTYTPSHHLWIRLVWGRHSVCVFQNPSLIGDLLPDKFLEINILLFFQLQASRVLFVWVRVGSISFVVLFLKRRWQVFPINSKTRRSTRMCLIRTIRILLSTAYLWSFCQSFLTTYFQICKHFYLIDHFLHRELNQLFTSMNWGNISLILRRWAYPDSQWLSRTFRGVLCRSSKVSHSKHIDEVFRWTSCMFYRKVCWSSLFVFEKDLKMKIFHLWGCYAGSFGTSKFWSWTWMTGSNFRWCKFRQPGARHKRRLTREIRTNE